MINVIAKTFLSSLEYQITGACIEVHKALRPRLLESIYHQCMCRELQIQNVNFVSEQPITIFYKDMQLDSILRADLFVENCIVVELKAVQTILPVHEAQLLTYMKLLKAPKVLLINFNCINIIQEGKKTFVSEYNYDI